MLTEFKLGANHTTEHSATRDTCSRS